MKQKQYNTAGKTRLLAYLEENTAQSPRSAGAFVFLNMRGTAEKLTPRRRYPALPIQRKAKKQKNYPRGSCFLGAFVLQWTRC